MRVELLRGAEADLLESYIRLEESRSGLGDKFYRTLDFALERIRRFPEIAPIYSGKYRRLVLRPFGFGIFYAIEGERVMVGAWSDSRFAPGPAPNRATIIALIEVVRLRVIAGRQTKRAVGNAGPFCF